MKIVFIHPPSIYDFRKHPAFLGPISEAVPSTPVFEMYPIGFYALANRLTKEGHHVRIVNLALKMLNSRGFDAEKFIRGIRADMFCIDLHWLAHTHGALEISRVCKKNHPRVPVVLGGLTATYYHDEILRRFDTVDYVLKGDSCELPLVELAAELGAHDKSGIPNLSWRNQGRIMANPIRHVPESFDLVIDPRVILKMMLRDRDIEAYLPYKLWTGSPIIPVLTSRGCRYNCAVCGGSGFAYAESFGRKKPAYLAPDSVIRQMKIAQKYFGAPVFFLNDIRMAGNDYYQEIFEKVRANGISVPVVFELFAPLTREFARDLQKTFFHYNLEMSPEDASEDIRSRMGKSYTNDEVLKSVEIAMQHGCDKFDLFFMIGLGWQRKEDVEATLEFIDRLLGEFDRHRGRIYPMISAYAPTIDPGSLAFTDPQKYGYRIFHRSLEEQYEAFKKLSWKRYFNYETRHMNVDDIVDTTYHAMIRLAEIKEKHGLISADEAGNLKRKVGLSREIVKKLDEIEQRGDEGRIRESVADLKKWMDLSLEPFIRKSTELNWPRSVHSLYMSLLKILDRLFF